MTVVLQFPDRSALSLNERINREVKALMARNGVNQMKLADWMSINQSSMSARLRGATEWKAKDIERVAAAFGVHPAVLLGGHLDGPEPVGPLAPFKRRMTWSDEIEWAPRDSNSQPAD